MTCASYGGTQPSRMRLPAVVSRPRVTRLSLIAIGTPASGEVAVPAARAASSATSTSPMVSAWNWSTAPLPTRTGAEPS